MGNQVAIFIAIAMTLLLLQPFAASYAQHYVHIASPHKNIYAYAFAGRPLILSYVKSLGPLAKLDPAYIHVYAYVGSKLVELPVRVYSFVEEAKFLKHGATIKLFLRTSTPRYLEVWLPKQLPKCLSAYEISKLFKNPFYSKIRELKIRINPLRDPVARQIIKRIAPTSSSLSIGVPTIKPIANELTLCLYVAYEPRIPNPYIFVMSIETPNYVISNELQGITPEEISLFGSIDKALNIVKKPIEIGITVTGRDIALPSTYESYELPTGYFIDISPGLTSWEGIDYLDFKQVVKVGNAEILPLEAVAKIWANATEVASGSCKLHINVYLVKVLVESGRIVSEDRLLKIKSSTYDIKLGKASLIVDTTYLMRYDIENLLKGIRRYDKYAVIEYEVYSDGCSVPIAIGVDRVVITYAKYDISELDRMYEVGKFLIDLFGSKNVREDVYPNGYVYYVHSEGNRITLDIGTGVSKAEINLIVPGAVGNSLIWRFKEISIPLKVYLHKGVVPVTIRLRMCLGVDGGICSSWKTINGGESTTLSIKVPQPSFEYSLGVQQIVPLTLTIIKPKDLAIELDIEKPSTIVLPARMIEAVEVGRSDIYFGYSSLPVIGIDAPLFETHVLSYVDTAYGMNGILNFTQSYVDVDYGLASALSLVWRGASHQTEDLTINFMGIRSSLNFNTLDIVVNPTSNEGRMPSCYKVSYRKIVPKPVEDVESILTFLSIAIRAVDTATALSGHEEVALVFSMADIPIEVAHKLAEHSTEAHAYCVGNVAEIVGPRIGYLEGISATFKIELHCGINANVFRINIEYSLSSGLATARDEFTDTINIPIKCPP